MSISAILLGIVALQQWGWGQGPATAERPAVAQAAARIGAILDRLSGGKRSAMRGLQLGWTSYATGKDGKKVRTGEFLAALEHPDRLRIEARHANGTTHAGRTTVFKSIGGKDWIGPSQGPFVEVESQALAELEATFLLLGTLAGWDLLDGVGSARLTGGVLSTRASWHASKNPPEVRRTGHGSTVEVLRIGDRSYRLRGELAAGGGQWARTVELLQKGRSLEFTRFIPDCSFKKGFFRPEKSARQGRVSGRRWTLNAPFVVTLAPRYEIRIKDPGTWRQRLKRQEDLGKKLMKRGQWPFLAMYTSDGYLVMPFRPDPDRKTSRPRAPKGHRFRKVPGGLFAVLHVHTTWGEARALLTKGLLSYARELGLRPQGNVLLEPKVEPGKHGVDGPSPTTRIIVKGQLRLR